MAVQHRGIAGMDLSRVIQDYPLAGKEDGIRRDPMAPVIWSQPSTNLGLPLNWD